MADSSRSDMEIRRSKIADFDEQLWTVNCAVLILTGFSAGVVIAKSDFTDPRLLYNGWMHLAGIMAMVPLLIGGVLLLKGKIRRRFQLGILISLLVHLCVALFLDEQILRITDSPSGNPTSHLADSMEAERAADFHWTTPEEQNILDDEELVYDEPLETFPQEASSTASLDGPAASLREPNRDLLTGGLAPLTLEPAMPQHPGLPNLARAELSAPRRAEQIAGGPLSRQEWKHLPQPGEPIPEPNAPTSAGEAQGMLDAKVAALSRQESSGAVFQRRAFDEPEAQRHYPVVGLTRHGNRAEPLEEKPTTPTPLRQILNPAEVVRSEAVAPESLGAGKAADAAGTPGPTETAAVHQRESSLGGLTKISQPPTVALPQPADASAVRGPARVETTADTTVGVAVSAADVAAHAALPRASLAGQAAPAEGAAGSLASDGVAGNDVGGSAEGSPAATTVARSQESSPVSASEPGRGDAVAPMTHAMQLPAVSAKRAAGQRDSAETSAGLASMPQTLARSSVGLALPSTILPVLDDRSAAAAAMGGSLPSAVDTVSKTTAVTRSTANQAPTGSNMAAAGAAEFAVGSGPLLAHRGLPRASGLGDVSAAPNSSAPRIAKTPTANMLAAGIIATTPVVAAASAGGAATSGGSLAPSAGTAVNSTERGGDGELAGLLGMPDGESTVGASVSQVVGLVGPAAVARREAPSADLSVGTGTALQRAPIGTLAGVAAGARVSEPALGGAGVASGPDANGAGGEFAGGITAQASAPSRQTPGLMGSRTSEPMAGAVASMTNLGRPLPVAMARRAAPSQNPGNGQEGSPNISATIAKSNNGGLMPSMAAPSEPIGMPGAGGVGIVQGGMTSKLDAGTYASVERHAGGGSQGKTAIPGGFSEAGVGARQSLVLAGPMRVGGDGATAALAATSGVSLQRASSDVLGQGSIAGSPSQLEVATSGGVGTGTGADTADVGGVSAGRVAASDTSVGRGSGQSGDGLGALGGRDGDIHGVPATDGLASPLDGPQAGPRRSSDAPTAAIRVAAAVEKGGSLQRAALGLPMSDGTGEGDGVLQVVQGTAAATAASGDGGNGGVGISVSATGASRQSTGLPGVENGMMHIEGARVAGPAATTPGLLAGPRRLPQGMEGGPPIAAEIGGGPIGKADAPGLVRGLTETIEPMPVGDMAAAQAGTGFDPTIGSGVGQPQHQEGGLPVLVSAPPGPGGLGGNLSRDLGIPSRLARTESDVVHTVARRFVIERSSGGVSLDGSAREATPPYEQRDPRLHRQSIDAHGGDGYTERAVEVGVDFFARIQFPDGHWSLNKLPPGVTGDDPALGSMDADTAATGLALLTYLGAGYTHLDDKHREIVRRGVDWLVRNQKPDGELFTGGSKYARFYSHGIAAISLCEAYGMTQDPELREPARKAIDFILKSQHPKLGGWRYDTDPKTGKATETDTSVTGWQLMALKSAQMAGLEVPADAFSKVSGWLDLAQAENGKSIYNPFADKRRPEQLDGLRPNLAMSAEGMLMRLYVGHSRNESSIIAGADFLKDNLPQVGTAKTPERDCYYWYYATQAMFQMQGEYWTAWNDRMRSVLQSSQADKGVWAGSWHPNKPIRDRWGDAGGRLYVTAMHLLMLEVYYRHLPLYQELSK